MPYFDKPVNKWNFGVLMLWFHPSITEHFLSLFLECISISLSSNKFPAGIHPQFFNIFFEQYYVKIVILLIHFCFLGKQPIHTCWKHLLSLKLIKSLNFLPFFAYPQDGARARYMVYISHKLRVLNFFTTSVFLTITASSFFLRFCF